MYITSDACVFFAKSVFITDILYWWTAYQVISLNYTKTNPATRAAAALHPHTTAPASSSARTCRPNPCGFPSVPVTEATTTNSRPSLAACSRASGEQIAARGFE